MTDYFAVLNEPRRPWIEPAHLKSKFLARTGDLHPDRMQSPRPEERAAATRRYAELNAAFNTLKDPRTRTRHLLELELGRKPEDLHEIPPELAEVFLQVAQINREVASFLVQRARASSPLLRLQFFERGHAWTGRLDALRSRLELQQNGLLEQLRNLDAEWRASESDASARGRLIQRLDEIQRLLGFYARWIAQMREALLQLAL